MIKKITKVNEFQCAELAVDIEKSYVQHLILYFDKGEKIISYCLN